MGSEPAIEETPSPPPRGDWLPPEELPEPLVPRLPRSERDEDRLHALAHFSAGRAAGQRGEYERAIRHYQRALRYDPAAKRAVWPIVALAEQLKWKGVRDRYLLVAARVDPDSLDPADLIKLSDLVSNEDEARRVVGLFEKALADRKEEKPTPLDVVLRWRLAEICLAFEQYGQAADCAGKVLAALEHPERFGLAGDRFAETFGPAHPPYGLFGECFLLGDRLAEAQGAFEKAQRIKPDAGWFHYQLARIEFKRKKPEAALVHLEACLGEPLADEEAKPYALLRDVLDRLGKSDELPGRLERLLAKDPKNASLALFAAEEHLRAGRLDAAAAIFGRLLQQRPSPAVYAGLMEVYRKQGRVEELLGVLGKAVDQDSLADLGEPVKALISDKAFLGRLLAAADERLWRKPPTLGRDAALAAALVAMEAHEPERAEPFFETALRAAPAQASDVLLLWGEGLMTENRMDKAAEVLRRAVEARPPDADKPMLYYYLASALEIAGRTDAAIEAVRQAQQLKKDSPLLASHEGWILYHAGRNEPARAVYEQVVERFDANHSGEGVRQILRETRLILSHLEALRGDREKAAERLEEVLDEFPDDVSAMNDLGYLWAEQGLHLERSLEIVQRAVDAEPANAAYRDSLGWALYRLGRLEDAARELEKAAGDLADGEILDHLGEVYLKLGKTREAADAWRKAAEAWRKANEPDRAAAVEKKRDGLSRNQRSKDRVPGP